MNVEVDNNMAAVEKEDRLRAETYLLLARLLEEPPNTDLLDQMVANLKGDESPFGRTVNALAAAAASPNHEELRAEFHALFIGLDRGELVPYASHYIAGALYSRPLAKLRTDMAELGIARAQQTSEPEDHISALFEMMAGLILGSFAHGPASAAEQKEFFQKHLLPWAPRLFADLEGAQSAVFYKPVGRLGRQFMEIERAAFDMVA